MPGGTMFRRWWPETVCVLRSVDRHGMVCMAYLRATLSHIDDSRPNSPHHARVPTDKHTDPAKLSISQERCPPPLPPPGTPGREMHTDIRMTIATHMVGGGGRAQSRQPSGSRRDGRAGRGDAEAQRR